MLDYEQHIGIEHSEVRDFLAQSLLKISHESSKAHNTLSEEKKTIYNGCKRTSLDYAERAVIMSQKELDYATEIHRINKMKLGVFTIMNERGWREHDMGEYLVDVTYPYLNFIGTEDEAAELIKQIKK